MGFLKTVGERISRHPILFLFVRRILENDFAVIRALIQRELRTRQGLRTLDLACGPGTFSRLFEGDDYVGADLDARHIDHARRRRQGAFVVVDARMSDLPDARFDQVLIFGLLHRLHDDDVRAVLAEARRVLVPGGRLLVIAEMCPVSPPNLIGRLIRRIEGAEHVRRPEEYRRLFAAAAGMEHEETLHSGVRDYYAAVLSV